MWSNTSVLFDESLYELFVTVDYFLFQRITIKARLQPFTVLFSFSAILVCFIDAQIHSCFREKMSGFDRQ